MGHTTEMKCYRKFLFTLSRKKSFLDYSTPNIKADGVSITTAL